MLNRVTKKIEMDIAATTIYKVVENVQLCCRIRQEYVYYFLRFATAIVYGYLQNKTTNEDKRKMKQKELAASLNQAARDRLAEQTGSKQEKS
jgi:hypothetical protein